MVNSSKEKAILLAKSIKEWAGKGFPIISPDNIKSRVEICKGCDFWDQKGFGNTGKCTKCGCSTQAKLRMATAKCPIDKWGAIEVVKTD
jgi:hypothetical protein